MWRICKFLLKHPAEYSQYKRGMFKFSRPQKGDNYMELNIPKPLGKVNLVEKSNELDFS